MVEKSVYKNLLNLIDNKQAETELVVVSTAISTLLPQQINSVGNECDSDAALQEYRLFKMPKTFSIFLFALEAITPINQEARRPHQPPEQQFLTISKPEQNYICQFLAFLMFSSYCNSDPYLSYTSTHSNPSGRLNVYPRKQEIVLISRS